MPDPASVTATPPSRDGGNTVPIGSAPDVSEQSSLTAHADSTATYHGITSNYGATTSTTPSSSSSLSSSSHTDVDADSTNESSSKQQQQQQQQHDDEEALLQAGPPSPARVEGPLLPALSSKALLWIITPMLLAVFLSNADSTIVMATHAVIASDFLSLDSSAWLFTGFVLASTATQTTWGQLSGIFGRKPIMMLSYLVFGLGLLITGAAGSMVTAILGRILSGAVSAGNNVLVTLVVTDLLPMREVAAWRSYINVVAVVGRSVGGPLGGWLADVIGWRLSFIGQAPFFLLTLILCWISLPNTKPQQQGAEASDGSDTSTGKKLRQVDFLGSFLLAAFLVFLLLPLEFGGHKLAWTDPQIPIFLGVAALALVLFIVAEKRRASSHQLLPLSMFRSRHTVSAIAIMILQCAAQVGMMFTVPLYFQVTQRLSTTDAGVHLVPAVVGNAIGGIVAGSIIRNTGKYRWLIFLAAAMSASSYILLILRWHGNTNGWESLYIFPGGFGTGVTLSAIFIAVQASVDKAHLAPAVSMVYLAQGLGVVLGLAATSAAYQAGLRSTLEGRLVALHLDANVRNQIIADAMASVDYVRAAKGEIATAIVASYVDGLWFSHFVSLLASVSAFALAALLRDYKL